MAEAITVAIGAVVAVPFYPDQASALAQAGISSAAVVAATMGLLLIILLGNWVAFSARGQRDEAGKELERLQERANWRAVIEEIGGFIAEGNRAMEAYGRPLHLDTERGMKFMVDWMPRVTAHIPPEYAADLQSQGREIYQGDTVWAMLLDVRLKRLHEIAVDIRNHHL